MALSLGHWLSIGLLGTAIAGAADCPKNMDAPALPVVEHGSIVPTLPDSLAPKTALSAREGPFRGLKPEECQCAAVRSSKMGNLLEGQELDPGHALLACLPTQKAKKLYGELVGYAADEARNRSAGEALETYYQLAEALGRDELLLASFSEVADLLNQMEDLAKQGLRPKSDVDSILRQRNEVLADRLQVRLALDQLDAKLKVLLGLPCTEEAYLLWPTTELRVDPRPIDADESVAIGLNNRLDLKLLRAVQQNLDVSTLPVVRQMLAGVNVLLAGPPRSSLPGAGLITALVMRHNGTLEKIRHDLDAFISQSEKEAAVEIRQRLKQVETQIQLIALARQRMEIAERKVEEWQEKKNKGLAIESELSRAKLDRTKARGDLLHEVIAWEIARARLREAQGLLGCECLAKE